MCHQPFVGHGANGFEVELAGQVHVAGADEAPGEIALEDVYCLLLHAVGEAPAGAEISQLEAGQFARRGFGLEPVELLVQALGSLLQQHFTVAIAVAHFADDGQQRHLEEDHVQPGAAQTDAQLAVFDAGVHVAQVEAEQAEETNEVRFDERDAFEEGQLVDAQAQLTEAFDLVADLGQVGRQILAAAAAEFPFHLGIGVVVQHRLHHGQLVEIGVQQVLHGTVGENALAHRRFSLASVPSSCSRLVASVMPCSRMAMQALSAVSLAMARQAGRCTITSKPAPRSCRAVVLTQ